MSEPVGSIKHSVEPVGEYSNIEIWKELPPLTKLYIESPPAPLPELTFDLTTLAVNSLRSHNKSMGDLTFGHVGEALEEVWKEAAKIPRWKPIEEYKHDKTVMVKAPEMVDEFNPEGIGQGVLNGDVWAGSYWSNSQDFFRTIEIKPTHFLEFSRL